MEFRPEPRNEHGRNVVAVFSCRDVRIGYLTADRAPELAALLGRTQMQAVFQRQAAFGAWIRVAFDGEAPVLTDAVLVETVCDDGAWARDEPDFYPDEV